MKVFTKDQSKPFGEQSWPMFWIFQERVEAHAVSDRLTEVQSSRQPELRAQSERPWVFTMELVHNGRPWLLSIVTDMWFTVLPQRVVVCRESTTVKMDYTEKKGGRVQFVLELLVFCSFFGVLFKQFAQGQHPITTSVLYFGGICLLPKYSTVLHSTEPCQKQPFICKNTVLLYLNTHLPNICRLH